MRKKQKRIAYEDRLVIEKMLKNGDSIIEIANKIGVHQASIYNELRRCRGSYDANIAQQTLR